MLAHIFMDDRAPVGDVQLYVRHEEKYSKKSKPLDRQFRKLREQNQMELKFPVRKARKSGALSIRPKILELLDLPTS